MSDLPSDENITMLLGMGFADLDYIRKALTLAKNDLNEAVAILTGEDSRGLSLHSDDVEMRDTSNATNNGNNNTLPLPLPGPVQFGPQEQDIKIEIADTNDEQPAENINIAMEDLPDEFPVTNMYELEQRVFTDNWSIPYKVNESLAKCLYGAIKLSHSQKTDADENCLRFLETVLPECMNKLLCTQAVRKWNRETDEGVFNMIQLFIDLMALRLQYLPHPIKLLTTLASAFDPDCEYHYKNRSYKSDRTYYEDLFGFDKCPAMSPPINLYKEPFGWLVNLVNRFAHKDGIKGILFQIDQIEKLTPHVLACLLRPLGVCSPYLNQDVVGHQLGGAADKIVQYIQALQATDMKEKEVDKVYDLLRILHQICEALWPDKTSAVEELHLNTILKMLNLPHFNARMNAVKELSKLIVDTDKEKRSKYIHQQDVILQWLLENKVLSIAFSSSLHHSQYCEKLKKIVEFAGAKISMDELTTIWDMQKEKHITVVQNIHDIIASLAQTSSTQQLEHLVSLFEKSWKAEDDKSKERLLLLIGKIGGELKDQKIVIRLLELLWEFAHVTGLPLFLLNQAVQSHLDVLTESSVATISLKHDYVKKCVHDIQDAKWVVPAIRHILKNLQSTTKAPYSKDSRAAISQLQEQYSLLKQLSHSLVQSHKFALSSKIPSNVLTGETIINGMYPYGETIITHLKLIEFILQDGGLYLNWNRCKEIWDCLMLDNHNCEGDYETCFEWFVNCIADINAETQKDIFTQKILKTDISKLNETGFNCFKSYFECVNIHEHRMRKSGSILVIERQDLTGISYLWLLVLESPYPDIAESAANYLIKMSFSNLSSKLKKQESAAVHKRFIGECYKKLDTLLQKLSSCEEKENKKTFKKPLPIKGSTVIDRGKLVISIERLLNLVCLYINIVEDGYTFSRSFPPHGHCFYGFPIDVHVIFESNKSEFNVSSHSNETLKMLRDKLATQLNVNCEQTQIYKAEKLLSTSQDHKLLTYLEFDEKQQISVKILTMGFSSSVNEEEDNATAKRTSLLERERGLPSFILAVEFKVFEKLYQLAELEDAKITSALQNLYLHLPTDGDVLQAIDVFSFQNPLSCSPGTRAGYTKNSASVLENYFKCSAPQMSTLRVLYNLQVLSSKLMPVSGLHSSAITHSFRENWLNAGGLSLIMNILQPDTLPKNADYELRQSCYYIILQLARFLLCGESYESSLMIVPTIRTYGQATQEQLTSANSSYNTSSQMENNAMDISLNNTSTPVKLPHSPNIPLSSAVASSWPGAKNESPLGQLSSSPGSAASCTPENGSVRKRLRSASIIESISPTVRMAIENLNEMEYSSTISSLLQVTWAAAAGKLYLNTTTSNTDSQDEEQLKDMLNEKLKAGICLQQQSVSSMDGVLANNAFELLVMCLQLRPKLLNVFYNIPKLSEFIIDVLTGSPSVEVRQGACMQLSILANTQNTDMVNQNPKAFLLNLLMKAQLPVWTITGSVRGLAHKITCQCEQYFDVLCNLVYLLTINEQQEYGIVASKLLDDELTLLTNSENLSLQMLNGHLKFTNILFTCQGVIKDRIGPDFIQFLLDEFLFCASKTSNGNISLSNFSFMDINTDAYDPACRKSAFNLLLTLADRCSNNLLIIANELITRHHNAMNSNLWEFQPAISSRPVNGFVGLKNAGATCYMNSVIQQLYMQPGLHEAILKMEDKTEAARNTNILQLTQTIFGHLLESQTQFYTPQSFWDSFRLWGEPVNLREQQDAFEFFINFTDQVDERLKEMKKDEIFKKTFNGMFVDQKICKECCHRFERDELFFSLPVTVKCGSLEASLEQFVHTEIMEGENAYYCEKCCEQRTTVKRTCIKSLPPVLAIQLKRFYYDWERNRAIKFNDYFSFPWVLDMEPYTCDGIAKQEKEDKSNDSSETMKKINIITDNNQLYELVGVIVHSGQANAGHYYSLIKNRQATTGEFNSWYKFNDIAVEKFEMNDNIVEVECFGGDYKVPQTDRNSQYPEKRNRNWNAYILFYETMDKTRLLPSTIIDSRGAPIYDMVRSYPSSPSSSTSSNPPSPGSKDSLSQLSALIRKGEKKGLFIDNMPSNIKRQVNEENINFMKNRDVYNEEYFHFVRQLVSANKSIVFENVDDDPYICCIKLAVHFLFNTYLKCSKSLMSDLDLWVTNFEFLLAQSRQACIWFINFVKSDKGKEYLIAYVLECPDVDSREAFTKMLHSSCDQYYKHFQQLNVSLFDEKEGESNDKEVDGIITVMLTLLEKHVTTNMKHAHQYFTFFMKYAHINSTSLCHLSDSGCFQKFYHFIISSSPNEQKASSNELSPRRWSSSQTQELVSLHKTLLKFILSTSNEELRIGDIEEECPCNEYDHVMSMSHDIQQYWYGVQGEMYIRECLCAYIELPKLSATIIDAFMYSCWCNLKFSIQFLRKIMMYLSQVQVNDIKNLFTLLIAILKLVDGYQGDRVALCIGGSEEKNVNGLLNLIRSCQGEEDRRVYQCIKFLVSAGKKIAQVKTYLLENNDKWQWAVNWLKSKMTDHAPWPSTSKVSNDKNTSFQRTVSAQNTLTDATNLLTDMQRKSAKKSDLTMDTCDPIQEEDVTS